MARTARQRQEEQRLDRVFAALANPTRRALLVRLAAGPASVGELAGPHRMTLPGVSSHLRVLEAAGLLRRRREGRVQRCALEPGALHDAHDFVQRYRVFWEQTLESLARFAEGTGHPAAPARRGTGRGRNQARNRGHGDEKR